MIDIGADLQRAFDEGYEKGKADRPQGEWIIEIDINNYTYGRCSICGMRQYAGHLNFCPNCGAHMKGTENNKECHKPESLYYRCYCDERKEDEYCNGCRFWYESQTERISK